MGGVPPCRGFLFFCRAVSRRARRCLAYPMPPRTTARTGPPTLTPSPHRACGAARSPTKSMSPRPSRPPLHTPPPPAPPPDAPPPAAPPTRRTRRRRRTADRAGGCDGGVAVGSGLGSLRGVRPREPGPDPEGGRGGLRRPRPGDVAGLPGHGRGPLRRGDHHRRRRPREIPGQLRRLGRPGPSRRRRLPGDDSDGRRRRSVLEHRGRVHLRGPARHRSRQGGRDLQHNYLYMATLDRSSGSWIVVSDERMGVDQC